MEPGAEQGYVCVVCQGKKALPDGSLCPWCAPEAADSPAPARPLPRPAPADAQAEANHLIKLANTRMPFGKYAGRLLIDLPETYLLWFRQNGWPEGELGRQLAEVCGLVEEGLEKILRPLIKDDRNFP